MEHLRLICDIGEMSGLFEHSMNLQAFLDKTVRMVANHMEAPVCSIYVYDEADGTLALRATQGLNPKFVGEVRLARGEGLVGLALEELRTVREAMANKNVNFKAIPGIQEERYKAFLAVPIARGLLRIGVLVVQRSSRQPFSRDDALTLRAVASQLANPLENARLLMADHSTGNGSLPEAISSLGPISARVASDGLAIGPAVVVDREGAYEGFAVRSFSVSQGLTEFDRAVRQTEEQLEHLQQQVEDKLSDVASLIFTSHLLILKDEAFTGRMRGLINDGSNAPDAAIRIARDYIQRFAASQNDFVREKVHDVKDLVVRLLRNLTGEGSDLIMQAGTVVVANDLYPSDLLRMATEKIAGVVLVTGGVTSHVAILARSLQVPIGIVDDRRLLNVVAGATILLDAEIGTVTVNPGAEAVAAVHRRQSAEQQDLAAPSSGPVVTRDGTTVRLLANVNLLADIDLAHKLGADGIGLYRSEFHFMVRSNFPSEEEQYVVYREAVKRFPGKPISLRTLDIGGDKVLSYFTNTHEKNPFLGMRSIRFSLEHRDIFRQQIRAMLRAGRGARLRIMFPLVSSLDEYLDAKEVVLDCVEDLRTEDGIECQQPELGIMVEVPSVLPLMEAFAEAVDFMSIGTNDLIQYLLAVDRTNEKVAKLYRPHHPSVLRTLHRISEVGMRYEADVSVCGDMAHYPEYVPFLMGIGIRNLSVEPIYLPRLRRMISAMEIGDAQEVAQRMLECVRIDEVEVILRDVRQGMSDGSKVAPAENAARARAPASS